MKNFGARIKSLRIEKGLTQPQLAEKIGVSKGIISQWENDVYEPKASYILALAKFFDVTCDYLLGADD